MRNSFRSKVIIESTRVYGVIGSPVSHSLSPLIFNRQFAADALDAVYLPLLIDDEQELGRFLETARRCTWLNARGFSVTLPHKSAALRWAGDGADTLARRIGAANTLVLAGPLAAFNTDYSGAIQALHEDAGLDREKIAGLTVAVLGAGGVARAVVAGLCDAGASVTIYNRTHDRSQQLADEFGAQARSWDDRINLKDQLVINCTKLGMAPDVDQSPLPQSALQHQPVVFDTIYTPTRTRLLRQATAAGCKTVAGPSMFVHQAAAQYNLWTGRRMDIAEVTQCVTQALAHREQIGGPS
jgi:3-dehydroquinate dehydratase/shikimate dehydrogenase